MLITTTNGSQYEAHNTLSTDEIGKRNSPFRRPTPNAHCGGEIIHQTFADNPFFTQYFQEN